MKIKKIILQISGMHCASCSTSIEQTLKKQEGVLKVNVNLASEKANLEFESNKINIVQIKKIIQKLGYQAQEQNFKKQTIDNQKNLEIKNLKKRFIVSLFLGLPLLYLVMGKMVGLPVPSFPLKLNIIIQLMLTTAIVALNSHIYVSGLKKLIQKNPNMDSLIGIGTLAAYFYSLAISVNAWLYPNAIKEIHLYFESAAFILIFISLGKYLEASTKARTSQAIKKLIGLQPKQAIVIKNGQEIKIPISEVKVNDIILVKPGGKIPVDGIIIDGYSTIDESMLTGESMPVDKKQGNKVIAGTINKTGAFKFKAIKIGKHTMLAQIIKIVEQAMGSKAPMQVLADRVSFYFVPIVIIVALLALITWLILGQSFVFALTIFISILIIACPCALGLATPTAVMMGTGLAAQSAILIRNAQALETAHKLDIIIFDKTGTLTAGKPNVTDIIAVSKNEDEILQLSASLEKNSEHPLAQAIVKKAKEKNLDFLEVKHFEAIPGKGIKGKINEKDVLLGNHRLIKSDLGKNLENQGKTVIFLTVNQKVVGVIAIADTLKKFSKQAIKQLKNMKKQVWMITGDNKRTAQTIAELLGIEKDKIMAQVLPADKAKKVQELQEKEKIVAFVGDGINDAPALAQADLGIALGSGTDIAIETGEIILIKNDLRDVVTAIDLSSYTVRKIKQNLFWAFFYNSISIPVAAGILYPFSGFLLNPMIAAAAMAFSSVSVVLNALSMKKYKNLSSSSAS